MPNPQRLELTWSDKETRLRLEPRILPEDPVKSYHAQHRTGKVKCIYLTIKKIPNTVLAKCEWGHDDYSLQIENFPMAKKPPKKQPLFFDEEAE